MKRECKAARARAMAGPGQNARKRTIQAPEEPRTPLHFAAQSMTQVPTRQELGHVGKNHLTEGPKAAITYEQGSLYSLSD